MSLGYASLLSPREDLGGQLGAPELSDGPADVASKAASLAALLSACGRGGSPGAVVFTGAGISTACGIPDFRGPTGVWTLQRRGQPLPALGTAFEYARPSFTHMALVGLQAAGKVSLVVSQNVDGLHVRSGLPRGALAELHGNCFSERCEASAACGCEYFRDFQMPSVGFKKTGRRCTSGDCLGRLRDQVLDWDDALPEAELQRAEAAADAAPLALCLGTSLQIVPACNLPLRALRAREGKGCGKLVIVNLQATPKDKKATMVVHAKCDGFLAAVLRSMALPVPAYTATTRMAVSHWHGPGGPPHPSTGPGTSSAAAAAAAGGWSFAVTSVHGDKCPLPMVATVEVAFRELQVPSWPPAEPVVRPAPPGPFPTATPSATAASTSATAQGQQQQPPPHLRPARVELGHGAAVAASASGAAAKVPLLVRRGAARGGIVVATVRLGFVPECRREAAVFEYALVGPVGRAVVEVDLFKVVYGADGTASEAAEASPARLVGGGAGELPEEGRRPPPPPPKGAKKAAAGAGAGAGARGGKKRGRPQPDEGDDP